MSDSLLKSSRPDDVSASPFAHLVIDRALPDDEYRRLALSFPPPERFMEDPSRAASNQAVRIGALAVIDDDSFSGEWREFFRYHSSQAFWDDIVRVCGETIREAHPGIERKAGKPLDEWVTKRRGEPGETDVTLDVQFVINTPVLQESSVRPAHLDNQDKIFSALFYMKPEDDPTPGGDLALYAFKPGQAGFSNLYAPLSAIEEKRRVNYGTNRFVAFVNSPDSIHGVTPRPRTDRIRRYINFVAITPCKAFSVPRMPPVRRFRFWIEQQRTIARSARADRGAH